MEDERCSFLVKEGALVVVNTVVSEWGEPAGSGVVGRMLGRAGKALGDWVR